MILGKICGRVTTTKFSFVVDKPVQNLEYIQVHHERYGYVLCQIVELERDVDRLLAKCVVIGYKDDEGRVKNILEPFQVGSEVLFAEDDFVKHIVMLQEDVEGGYIGKLKGRDIPVHLDLHKLLTKHLAVLAKSGAGKSYFVGCLLEEIIERKVPLLLIDTHGEYVSLKKKNTDEKENARMNYFGVKPKSYKPYIVEYGNTEFNPQAKPLHFYERLTAQEMMTMLPSKLTAGQENLLLGILKNLDTVTCDELLYLLEQEESPVKNQVINMVQMLKRLDIFSPNGIDFNELIQSSRCSIINLRGINPDTQEIIVTKLLNDLFELRKKNLVPPFFCVIEEAHNFCPERSFGQAKCSDIIRNIASEGRKFGLGIGVISQRPARIDKSVLSQVTTQAILKVTNPNDLKAIMNSVEGISSDSESEIKNLAIGSGMITGIVDMPLFVNIRPRRTEHGGTSVDMLAQEKKEEDFFEKLEDFKEEEKELLPIVMPGISSKDFALMQEETPQKVSLDLIPAVLCVCKEKEKEYGILIERIQGDVIKNIDFFECGTLPKLSELNKSELKVLEQCFYKKKFTFEDFLSKFGGSLDVKNVLQILVDKNYLLFDKEKEEYSINPQVILAHLSKYAFYGKIEYKKVPYRNKISAEMSVDQIKKQLNTFTEVIDVRECFMGKYCL